MAKTAAERMKEMRERRKDLIEVRVHVRTQAQKREIQELAKRMRNDI